MSLSSLRNLVHHSLLLLIFTTTLSTNANATTRNNGLVDNKPVFLCDIIYDRDVVACNTTHYDGVNYCNSEYGNCGFNIECIINRIVCLNIIDNALEDCIDTADENRKNCDADKLTSLGRQHF